MVNQMFNISSQKDTITVKRSLTLNKEGILPAGQLDCVASIDIGVELKGADGKGIISRFSSNFNGKISSKAKKQDERIAKARQQLAKWVHLGESETKIRSYADTQQEDIIRDWNQFMRVDIKRAAYEALEDALKKSDIRFDDLKLKFSSTDLQDNKMEFLTGVLDIAGRGGSGRVAQSGMAVLVSGLQNLATPFSTLHSSWARNAKLLRQGAEDAHAISKNIAAMRKATAALNARLARMKKITDSSATISTQGRKGIPLLQAALAKHQKTAKINDADKVAIMLRNASTALTSADRSSQPSQPLPDPARLDVVLKDIAKLLAEAEQLSKGSTSGYMAATKASRNTGDAMKTGADAVAAALKELRIQFKTG